MKFHTKTICTFFVVIFVFISKGFSTGAGIQAGIVPGVLINKDEVPSHKLTTVLTGTIKSGRLPLVVGFGFEAGQTLTDFSYGIKGFCDYWLIENQLQNTWNFFSGLGFSGSIQTYDFQDFNFEVSARAFVGMNWLFYDHFLEFYVQQNIAPTYIKSTNDLVQKNNYLINFPFEAGLRMHY
ncbi:MAG: hypothetical protein J6X84_09380 [Treponema sp.]|nr:hypothetical protein [Treponema sp.]